MSSVVETSAYQTPRCCGDMVSIPDQKTWVFLVLVSLELMAVMGLTIQLLTKLQAESADTDERTQFAYALCILFNAAFVLYYVIHGGCWRPNRRLKSKTWRRCCTCLLLVFYLGEQPGFFAGSWLRNLSVGHYGWLFVLFRNPA